MRTIILAATIEFGRIHSAIEKASAWPVSLLHHLLLVKSPPPTYDSATNLAALSALSVRVLNRKRRPLRAALVKDLK